MSGVTKGKSKKEMQRKNQIAEHKNILIMKGREKYNTLFRRAGIELGL